MRHLLLAPALVALSLGTAAHAQEAKAPASDNLGPVTQLAAQPGTGMYRFADSDRRNAMIALGAVGVAAIVAIGVFDSSSTHEPTPPVITPPSHDG